MGSVGFIGGGNMAEALIGGIVKNGLYDPKKIVVYDVSEDRLALLEKTFGVKRAQDSRQLLQEVPAVVLAVKPSVLPSVIDELKGQLKEKLVISIAAGITIDSIMGVLGRDARVIRVMPNTPALVGEGAAALAASSTCSDADTACARDIFSAVGICLEMEEGLINAVTALSGSGPAFAFLFIEALADGGVRCGLPRDKALKLAAETLKGAAAMVSQTGVQPGKLKDMVTSPAGTTIEGISVLESRSFRSAVIDAVFSAYRRACELTK
ncbi:MAG TPA: pyrroline-5-carboxylate reductase [Deltaproteobacteria bacterium]|nr:pyrroline-5-carboxylate reductase [Deltaproteobacteria bacterium]